MVLPKGILFLYAIVSGILFFLGPCDETLPPYSEPEVFLKGEMRAQYVCTWASGNRMTAFFDVTNIYEETLDDTVRFRGTIEIRSVKRPDIKRTFTISAADLSIGPGYNRQTGRLSLNPEATLVFSVNWDLSVDDRGIDPRAELFTFYDDPLCNDRERCIALKEEFIISGEILIFDQRAPVRAMTVFPLCYYSAALAPPFFDCTQAQTDPPCVIVADTLQDRCFPFGQPPSGSLR